MKRCFSAALVILMLVGLFAIPAAADAELAVILTPSQTEPMAVGDTFTIAVGLESGSTIGNMDVRLMYDKNVLEIDTSHVVWAYPQDSGGNDAVKAVAEQSAARYGAIVWAAGGTVAAEAGAFVTVPFKIKTVPGGYTTEISLTSREVEGVSGTYYNVVSTPVTISIDHEHVTDHDHSHARLEASCTDAGNIEYYECTYCHCLFSDAAMTQEVTQEETVIPAPGHTMTHYPRKNPTATEDGNIEYWYCTVCENYYTTESGYNADRTDTTEISQEDTVIPKGSEMLGDVNNDGEVGLADLMMLKRYCGGLIDTMPNLTAGDVNVDGTVGLADLMMLKRFCGGLIDHMGPT